MDVGRTSVLTGHGEPAQVPETNRHTLVVFELDGREFALPIDDIAEILQMVLITPVPEVPPWVAGMVNLRGRVIPVIDLRTRLGMEPRPPRLNTPLLIAEQGTRKLGLIADAVRDVIAIEDDALERPAEPSAEGHADAMNAVAQVGERLIVILDLARIAAEAGPLAEPRSSTSRPIPLEDVTDAD